ncbi:MAG: hypothetical protein ACO1PM_25340 [Acidovorax sp.]
MSEVDSKLFVCSSVLAVALFAIPATAAAASVSYERLDGTTAVQPVEEATKGLYSLKAASGTEWALVRGAVDTEWA